MANAARTHEMVGASLRAIFAAIGVLVFALPAAGQDIIAIRESTTVQKAGPVTLADVAVLTGEGAQRLADVIVDQSGPAADGSRGSVRLEQIRAALETRSDIHWGRLVIRGSACSVRRAVSRPAPTSSDLDERPAPGSQGPTVREAVADRIAAELGVDPEDLRLSFEDADSALLGQSVTGRTVEVRLMGSSDRQPVAIRVFDGLRTAASGTIRVGLSVRRDVCIALTGLRRGDVVDAQSVRSERRWISPTLRPARLEEIVGKAARTRIESGEVIEDSETESPMIVKRGDLIEVYCLAGGVSVKAQARALDSAREGEVIRLESVGSKRYFKARVDGPGRAVTNPELEAGDLPAANKATKKDQPGSRAAGNRSAAARPARDDDKRALRYADMGDKPVKRADPRTKDQNP